MYVISHAFVDQLAPLSRLRIWRDKFLCDGLLMWMYYETNHEKVQIFFQASMKQFFATLFVGVIFLAIGLLLYFTQSGVSG